MPIQEDIRDHDYLGPLIRKGEHDGQMRLLLGMMEERFGAVPQDIRRRLDGFSSENLDAAARRIFKAERIEDLFTH